MAVCRVIKSVSGWNAGDSIEAFGDGLRDLVGQGVVEVIQPDEEKEEILDGAETVAEQPIEKRKRGRPKKGGE